ncbi:MAG: hypothetical protein R3F61_24490 [Myxococcota bacterium]
MREPPSGMDVTFTDRGFEVALVGALPTGFVGCFRSIMPVVLVCELVGGIGCFAAFVEGDLAAGPLLCLAAMLVVLGTLFGLVLQARAHRPKPGKLVLDGDSLSFTSVDGHIRMSLADIKAVDVIPVGLAIRPKRGMTHHVMMLNTSDAARRWLDEAIEGARKRYGTSAEVPAGLDALKKR